MEETATSSGWQTVIGKNPYSGGWLVFLETGGAYLRYLDNINGSEYRLNSNFIPSLNTWYHVAFVVNPAGGTMSSYVNGSYDASVSIPNGSITANSNPVNFAKGGSNFFAGLIDDVRIYNRALSAAEIAALYAGGK
jgi:hypothetical protein